LDTDEIFYTGEIFYYDFKFDILPVTRRIGHGWCQIEFVVLWLVCAGPSWNYGIDL
jgi:hypothetical protein